MFLDLRCSPFTLKILAEYFASEVKSSPIPKGEGVTRIRGLYKVDFHILGDQKKRIKQQNVVIDSFLCFKISKNLEIKKEFEKFS